MLCKAIIQRGILLVLLHGSRICRYHPRELLSAANPAAYGFTTADYVLFAVTMAVLVWTLVSDLRLCRAIRRERLKRMCRKMCMADDMMEDE
jgi:hypothetical protein